MNKKMLGSRYYQVIGLVVVLMLLLGIRLFVLTVFQQEKWEDASQSQDRKSVV